MNVLEKICAEKHDHINRTQHLIPQIVLEERAKFQSPPRGFCNALSAKKKAGYPALIAEIKKASPSKGMIRADFDPVKIALSYQNSGASCLSVLTDRPYFKGSDEDLIAARSVVNLPVLRKDFILAPYQLYESRSLGADCILLIMAALSDEMAKTLHAQAIELGMDVLVEIHDTKELDRALKLDPMMIGVNSRNLKTLDVDIATAFNAIEKIPDSIICVAESGIVSNTQLTALFAAGYNAFLVGESLMREDNINNAVKKLLGKYVESA